MASFKWPEDEIGVGTVTSVALAAPASVFSVSGSPIVDNGTLTLSFIVQAANKVWAGPTTGADATPTFRSLVSADLPAGVGSVTSVAMTVPSILSVAGSPITSSGTLAVTLVTQIKNKIFAGPAVGIDATPTFRDLVTADLPAGTGTVTSVALAAPAIFSVSGSPVTTTGTLTLSLATQNANKVWAGPTTGGDATPTFRTLVTADLPAGTGTVTSVGLSVPATSIFAVTGSPVTTSGTLGLTTTGTSGGIPYFSSTSQLASSALLTASQLIVGGGAGTTPATLSAGSQYQVLVMGAATPGYGQVNLAQSAAITGTLPVGNGGTGVTSLGTLSDAGTDGIIVTGGTSSVISNVSLAQHVADATHNGYLSSTDWSTFNNKGTVTSIGIIGTNAFTASNTPITSSGDITLTPTAITAKTGNYTIQSAFDSTTTWDVSGGSATATLPTAASINGKIYTIKKIDTSTNTVTIATTSSQTIDSRASSAIVLAAKGDYLTVISDGSNWVILGKQQTEILVNSSSALSSASAATTGNYGSLNTKVDLTYGIWEITAAFACYTGSVAGMAGFYSETGVYGSDGANSASAPSTNLTGVTGYTNFANTLWAAGDVSPSALFGQNIHTTLINFVINTSTAQSAYIVPRVYFTSTTPSWRGFIKARRIW